MTAAQSHRFARAALVLAGVAASLTLLAAPASAHSDIKSTSPVDGAVLETPPAEVRLTFDTPLLDDTDTISINDENGNVVKSIHPKPEGDSVAIPWPAGTPAGTYQVAYRVVCGDGHPVVGAISVTVNSASVADIAPATSSPTAAALAANETAAPPSNSPPTSDSSLPLITGAVVLVAAVIVLIVALLRRRGTPTTA
jgi:methionine-rich copper-binding protein CopC